MMPGHKLVRCVWTTLGRRCERTMPMDQAKHMLVDIPVPGRHTHVVPICDSHYAILDAANRIRFWKRRRSPSLGTTRVDDDVRIFGIYNTKANRIVVTQHFAELETPQQVYVLGHETIHWVLSREFGLLTSMGLDLLYQRPLVCLGGHSLHTWCMNALFEQTEGLNTPDA